MRSAYKDVAALLNNTELLENAWKNKAFHYLNDFNSIEDFRETITAPDSFIDIDGRRRFKDHRSNTVNTRNGIRITSDQPEHFKRIVYLVGLCMTYGWGADDEHTIASYLQRNFNNEIPEEEFIVYNYGYICGGFGTGMKDVVSIVKSLPIKKGDIVLFHAPYQFINIPHCDLSEKAVRPHEYGDVFIDAGHFSKNGNRMIADGIFDFLKEHEFFSESVFEGNDAPYHPANEDNPNEHKLLKEHKYLLKQFYKANIRPTVGAIVMNANPFTLGHLHLVKSALKQCDYLIVFVVEEDKSEIPFADRFKLVKENLAPMPNVFVRPSGKFIISSTTFKEYFNKEELQERTIDTSQDVTIFAKEIAPCLDISIRFVGQEPFDNVTAQYNKDMERILPQYGIKYVEIPRLENSQGVISASTVRKLVAEGNFDKVKDYVPQKTFEYLYNLNKQ